jgi:hypothetical protein
MPRDQCPRIEVAFVSGGGRASALRGLMPGLRRELDDLVRIPSVPVPGQIDEALLAAHDMVTQLFVDAGVDLGRLDLPDTAPVVVGHVPAPLADLAADGAPRYDHMRGGSRGRCQRSLPRVRP